MGGDGGDEIVHDPEMGRLEGKIYCMIVLKGYESCEGYSFMRKAVGGVGQKNLCNAYSLNIYITYSDRENIPDPSSHVSRQSSFCICTA